MSVYCAMVILTTTATLLRRSSAGFKDWLRDYLENSSVAGFAYYVTPGTRPKERIFWLTVHLTSIIFVIVMMRHVTSDYASIPTVTTVETSYYPVQEVDFPGIAICDVNKISYSETVAVAEEIMETQRVRNLTIHEITDMLKYLGHLYLFEFHDSETEALNLLHKLLIGRYKSYIPVILRRLKPSCRWMLQYCSWGGREQVCEDIFVVRKTGDGYCCTFNYARRSDDFGGSGDWDEQFFSSGTIERSKTVGSQFGLTVLLRPELNDYYYKILSVTGFKILIYSSLDYPDASSGSLREVLVAPRTESSLTLQATSFYSVPEVSRYNVAIRDCIFSTELSRIFQGYYSYSDCIMYCRIADIRNYCQCIPFFYPTPKDGGPDRHCDLRDLPCLKEYRNRWWRVKPRLERTTVPFYNPFPNGPDGVLNCSDCLPACTDVMYQVSVSSAPLTIRKLRMGRDVYELDDHSMVNIFFKHAGTVRLKHDVMFYWYELMSNYGGICGFFLGISLISIVELCYFFTLRLYRRTEATERDGNSRFIFVKAAKPSLRPLYWEEMMQPKGKY